jgi:RNA polymerase sigma-70 factor (ECF subfamily)
MVQAMARFSGDGEAAGDAVSRAFTAALVNRQMLERMPEPAMKAWLYATARNALVDMKRRDQRWQPLPEEELADAHQPDLTDRLAAEELVAGLPPSLAAPVRMKFFQGMNATEIGRAMGLPPATVRTRLRTALRLMRRRYTMQGENHG